MGGKCSRGDKSLGKEQEGCSVQLVHWACARIWEAANWGLVPQPPGDPNLSWGLRTKHTPQAGAVLGHRDPGAQRRARLQNGQREGVKRVSL